MNIRVGGPDYPRENNLKELVGDPIVLKQLQDMAVAAINDNY